MRAFLLALLLLACGVAHAGSSLPPGVPLDTNRQAPLPYLQNVSGRNGLRIAEIGDSRIGNATVCTSQAGGGYLYPVCLYTTSNYLAMASALSGGRLNTDPVAYGYSGGIYRSLLKVTVGLGGSNYTAPTFTSNCPGATIGAATLVGGVITAVPVTNAGTGNCPQPATITISDSTGSGAVLVPIVGGLGTFGQGGEQACATQYRIADVTNTNADIAIVHDGTNDIGFGATGQQAAACVQNIVKQLVLAGKRVILGNNLPRGGPSGLTGYITQQQGQYLNDLDRTMRWWAGGTHGLNDDQRLQGVALLDAGRECTDATSTNDYPLENYSATLPDCMPDGLHLGYAGQVIFAQKLLATLQSWGISFAPAENVGAYDNFNASYNPGGFLNSNPLMTGTGGGFGSAACSGTVATDYTVKLQSGTSNATCTASIETTRTDGFSGARQVITVGSTTGGGTLAAYKIQSSHGLSTFNLNVGDPIYLEADVEVSDTHKMTQLQLDITIADVSSNTLLECAWGATYGTQGYYADTGALGSLAPVSGGLGLPLHPITPRGATVCQVPTGAYAVTASLYIGADFSGAANSAGFTVKLANFTLRKFAY